MVDIIWTEPALADLDAIADYIAIENPAAAAEFVQRVFRHIKQLQAHPRSGSKVPELPGSRYRQLVEPPCRVFYRTDRQAVYILHMMRSERLFRAESLLPR
jgi:toxin ParE1/3/4